MGNRVIPIPAANDTNPLFHRSPIDLRIHNSEVFLAGRFHRWQASTTSGKDLDELSVHMAVDVTSPDNLTVDPSERNLFSFRSDTVSQVHSNVYIARGRLESPAGTRPFEMLVEVPEGHTAFLALSFVIRKEELGSGWKELLTGGSGAGGIDAERRLDPRAGVRDLELAAA
ncbi:MAG: hypothetical protein ABUL77_02905 [Bacteroidota bacterium]